MEPSSKGIHNNSPILKSQTSVLVIPFARRGRQQIPGQSVPIAWRQIQIAAATLAWMILPSRDKTEANTV